MSESISFTTPVGRMVGGDLFKAETKDQQGNPLLVKTGANIGQPTQKYGFGLAIAKTDPGMAELYGKFLAAGKQGFPSSFDAAGNCIQPAFSLKITDGDSIVPNKKGNKPCDREGYPGHFVLWFGGSWAPKVYNTDNMPIVNPDEVKRGYYIRVVGSVVENGNSENPGVYCNYNLVQLCGYGPEIVSGPDAATAFGASPVALPQGASASPLAPIAAPVAAAPALPGAPALPAPALPVAAPVSAALPVPGFTVPAPAVAAIVPPQPAVPVAAPIGVAAPVISPSSPAAPAPGPAADFLAPVAEPSYNVQGQVLTKSALITAGYTDAHFATMTAI